MSFFYNPSDTRDKKKLAAEMTDELIYKHKQPYCKLPLYEYPVFL